MDYFSKFLKPGAQQAPPPVQDHLAEFHRAWQHVKVRILMRAREARLLTV